MKSNPFKLDKTELYKLCRAVKKSISDHCQAFDDDDIPGIQLTVACNENMSEWDYQTGDNCYSGPIYFYRHWAVVGIYRNSNCKELSADILNQLQELTAN